MDRVTVPLSWRALQVAWGRWERKSPRGKWEAHVYVIKCKLSVLMGHKPMTSTDPRPLLGAVRSPVAEAPELWEAAPG